MTKTILLLTIVLTFIGGTTLSQNVFAAEQIDQSFTGPFSERHFIHEVAGRIIPQQSFQPTVDNISSVDLVLEKDSRNRGTFDVTITLDLIDPINSDIVGTVTKTVSIILNEQNFVHISFENPIPLISGKTYHIAPTSLEEVYWMFSRVDYYPNGEAIAPEVPYAEDFGFVTYYTDPETPEEQTEAIVDEVLELLESGDISTGNANSLTSTLENAIDKISADDDTAAAGMLGSFINKIEAMIDTGRINLEDGQALIDAAQAVIDNL